MAPTRIIKRAPLRLDVVEMMDGPMQGADRDLVKIWQKMNAPRFDLHLLKTKTVGARALPEGIEVTFESAEPGSTAPTPHASGRAIANGRDEGLTKLLFDDAPEAHGHSKTNHPQPTLGQGIGMAAEVAHGSCPDLPPVHG